jgi:signal transduction histidine kinase
VIWNWLSRRPWLVDVTLVGLLLLVTVVTSAHRHDGATGIGLGIAETLPLLVRRQRPVLVLALVTVAVVLLIVAGDWVLPLQLGLALYTLASISERRFAFIAGMRSFVVVVVTLAVTGELRFGDSLSRLVFLIAFWLLGDSIGSRRAYVREIEEKAARLERERETDARRAVAEEQARIARELHDVVAHALSVIVIQAAAADDVYEVDPTRVREPIRAIETAARAALGDLRRVLGVLHEEATYDPLPGLGRLDSLVEQVRATGLAVSLEIQGAPRPLPTAVDLSAYRIVQEALTNTLKHAGAEHASVRVRYGDALALEVRDDGSGTGDIVTGGSGLIGMRERAAMLGGSVDARDAPEGGYIVSASIPLGAVS